VDLRYATCRAAISANVHEYDGEENDQRDKRNTGRHFDRRKE
jgi:hypothetical protein